MGLKINRASLIKGLKIAAGSSLAIFLSGMMGLEFAASSGIITLLTVLDTRIATLKLTIQRILSFILSMSAAYFISRTDINVIAGFFIYLIIVTEFSYIMKWDSSISTNAVFGTHIFLSGEHMVVNYGMVMNELGLLIIGTSMAMIMNIKMPNLEKELFEDVIYTEEEIKNIFGNIVKGLDEKSILETSMRESGYLMSFLNKAEDTAMKNVHNSYTEEGKFYLNYFIMRKNQCFIMIQIIRSFMSIDHVPDIMLPAVKYLEYVGDNCSVRSNAEKMLSKLNILMENIRAYPLPVTRREFEARAEMFHILGETEEFLILKRDFYKCLSPEQMKIYFQLKL